jgi:hypothetical protein
MFEVPLLDTRNCVAINAALPGAVENRAECAGYLLAVL